MKKVNSQFVVIAPGEKINILLNSEFIGDMLFDETRQRWDATFLVELVSYRRSGRDLALLKLGITTCLHKAIYGMKKK